MDETTAFADGRIKLERDNVKKNPTSGDVARLAGVDKSTVSRVMSGHKSISQATRRRVLRIAQEIGYRPNALARMLSTHRTYLLGVIINSLWSIQADVVSNIQLTAEENGYQTLVCEARNDVDVQRSYIERFMELKVDGLILYPQPGIESVLSQLNESLPIVTIDNRVDASGISMVRLDNFESMYRLAEYIIGLGHKHIALIAGENKGYISLERERGFKAALTDAGIWDCRYLGYANYRADRAHVQSLQLLKEYPEITAMVIMGADATVGAMRAAAEVGRRIPDTLSLASFDDSAILAEGVPSVTCLAQPTSEMGYMAVKHIVNQLDDDNEVPGEFILEGKLIIRESTRQLFV